jgi:hypothetical protein
MSELVQFRVARAPQRRIPDPASLVEVGPGDLIDDWLGSEQLSDLAATYLSNLGVTPRTTQFHLDDSDLARFFALLRALDRALARAGNRPTPKQVTEVIRTLFDQAPPDLVQNPSWLQTGSPVRPGRSASRPSSCGSRTRQAFPRTRSRRSTPRPGRS